MTSIITTKILSIVTIIITINIMIVGVRVNDNLLLLMAVMFAMPRLPTVMATVPGTSKSASSRGAAAPGDSLRVVMTTQCGG